MTTSLRFFALLCLLAITACGESKLQVNFGPDRDEGPTTSGNDERERPAPSGTEPTALDVISGFELPDTLFRVSLNESPVRSGTAVSFTATVVQGSVDVTDSWTLQASVSPEGGVDVSEGIITIAPPGEYLLTVLATSGEDTLSAQVPFPVVAGELATLDVAATPHLSPAGYAVTFEVEANDANDNSLDPDLEGVTLTVEPGGHVVSDPVNGLALTEMGQYQVRAEAPNGVFSIDVFNVTWSDPETLEFSLEEYDDLDPGLSLDYEAIVEDRYGNQIETPDLDVWTVPDTSLVDGRRIQFLEEGIYTIYARVNDTPLEQSVGPVVVDGSGPVIDLKAPDRGSFQTVRNVWLNGTISDQVSGFDRAELNGEALSVDAAGNFDLTVAAEPGVNLIIIDAWDTEGHQSQLVQSFLYGSSFVEPGDTITNSLVARLNQQGINKIEEAAEDAVSVNDIRNAVVGRRLVSECMTIIPGTFLNDPVTACIYVDIHSMSTDGLDIQLTPRSGYAEFRGTLDDVRVNIKVHGTPPTAYPFIEANSVNLTGNITVSVSGGNLNVNLTSVNVGMSGFDMGLGGWPSWANEIITLGGLLEDVVRPIVEQELEDEILAQAPDAINDMLAELEIAIPLNVMGTTIHVDAIPQAVPIDSNGLSLVLKTAVEAASVLPDFEGPGSLRTSTSRPSYSTSPGFYLSVSDDFVNQILYSVWEAGLVNTVVDREAGNADMSGLVLLAPGATSFDIEFDPLLPPVFRPSDAADSEGELQLGDMLVDLHANFPRGEQQHIARLAVSVFAQAQIDMDSDDTISFEVVGEPEFYFDGVFSTVENLDDDDMAELLEVLLPSAMPNMLQGAQEFPLPSFEGYGINNPQVNVAGPSGDYFNFSGNLTSR